MADFIIFTGKPLASGAQIYARIMIKKWFTLSMDSLDFKYKT